MLALTKKLKRDNKAMNPIVFVALIVSIIFSFIFCELSFAQAEVSTGENHFAFLSKDQNDNLGDTFYRNNEFLRCEASKLCKPRDPNSSSSTEAEPLKKFAYFLGREADGFIVPVFLTCHASGSASAATAESLVPYLNQEVLENGDCLNEEDLLKNVNPFFVDSTLKVIQGYDGGCPKRSTSCMDDVVENFTRDLKNVTNIFSLSNSEKTDSGCLTNLLSSALDSLYQTLKLFVWDIPKGVFNVGKAGLKYFFGAEEDRSTAMLASSVMSDDMAKALTSWDLAEFYKLAKKNFFSFFGQIKEFYGEIIGCTQWSGLPYQSECLKKVNWSCPNCDHMLNFACGLTGQLGTGFLLGGILGTAKSISKMRGIKKQVATDPSKFNIVPEAVREMAAKSSIPGMLEKAGLEARRASFTASRYTRPTTQFFTAAKNDLKGIFGIGDSFRALIAATPLTMPYNLVYQRGKARAFRAMNELQVKNLGVNSLKLGRAYALRLDNIRAGFDDLLVDLNKLRGTTFDPVLFRSLKREYYSLVEKELRAIGVKVERLPDGDGLSISKAGESFEYRPNIADRLKNMPDDVGPDEMKRMLMNSDPIMTTNHSVGTQVDLPEFWKNIRDKAHTSRGVFTIKPDANDGYVYLGHFSAQTENVTPSTDCSGKLNGVTLLREQEVPHELPESVPDSK